ncbi:ABC transporter substrate-binding protein [Streptomyces sp. NPDC050546]|uniref:ABC transporter substrate-binding protein n=1 Tax=Streptomyces sp. NPDC050546 TaxID=3365628 RepID=UPI0037AA0548
MSAPARWRRLLAVTAAASALALGAAGCTGLPPATLGSETLRSTSDPAGGRLSSLVWDLPMGEPTTLDYQQAGDFSPYHVVSNLCDSLLRLNPDYSTSPGLARSWEQPDDRTLVLHLRDDVTFWDGTPLTSADVVYSLKRQLAPSAVAGSFFVNVKTIEATGSHTVTVRFTKPDELFLKELATTAGTVVQARQARRAGKKFGTATGGMMCSGPFELTKWTSGSRIELKANRHYWDPAYRARADKVTLLFVTDTTALTQALASGAIAGAYEVPNSALPTLKGSPRGQLYFGPSLKSLQMIPIQPTGMSANPDIRRALSLAVNREELARTVYRGAAAPSTTVLPETGWDPEAEDAYRAAAKSMPLAHDVPTAADLKEARALVAKHRDDLRPAVLAVQAGAQDLISTATVIQQAAESIGIKLTVRQLPALQFSSVFYDPSYRKGLDFALAETFLDIPDPLDWVPNLALTDGIFNWAGYSDPAVDSAGQGTADQRPESPRRPHHRGTAPVGGQDAGRPAALPARGDLHEQRHHRRSHFLRLHLLPVPRPDRTQVSGMPPLARSLLTWPLRLLGLAATMLVAAFALFAALNLAPGDPATRLAGPRASQRTLEAVRHQLGLDQPLPTRFWDWLGGLFQGDFGTSLTYRQSVSSLLGPRVTDTVLLVGYAAVLIVVFGVGLGVWSALSRRIGGVITAFTSVGLAVPAFVAASALVALLSVQVHWFPALGGGGPSLADRLYHLTLPAITLALAWAAYLAQITRASVREEAGREYVETARSRGLPARRVLRHHILRNAMIPISTAAGLTVGGLIAADVVVEQAFGLNGLGAALVSAVAQKDTPVVQAVGLLMVVVFIVVNAATDVLQAALDPRIRAVSSR